MDVTKQVFTAALKSQVKSMMDRNPLGTAGLLFCAGALFGLTIGTLVSQLMLEISEDGYGAPFVSHNLVSHIHNSETRGCNVKTGMCSV